MIVWCHELYMLIYLFLCGLVILLDALYYVHCYVCQKWPMIGWNKIILIYSILLGKPVYAICHMQTTKAQISLRIRAVWSAPFFVRCLDSVCGCAGRFESTLVANLEDRYLVTWLICLLPWPIAHWFCFSMKIWYVWKPCCTKDFLIRMF